MYGALPEDHDRHENKLLKYEDVFRVRTEEIHVRSLALGGALLEFHTSLRAELRVAFVAFVLNLLDLGDEELPGALGAREVQGGLAQADQDVVVLDGSFTVDTILLDLQKIYHRRQTDNTEETCKACLIQRFQLV